MGLNENSKIEFGAQSVFTSETESEEETKIQIQFWLRRITLWLWFSSDSRLIEVKKEKKNSEVKLNYVYMEFR